MTAAAAVSEIYVFSLRRSLVRRSSCHRGSCHLTNLDFDVFSGIWVESRGLRGHWGLNGSSKSHFFWYVLNSL